MNIITPISSKHFTREPHVKLDKHVKSQTEVYTVDITIIIIIIVIILQRLSQVVIAARAVPVLNLSLRIYPVLKPSAQWAFL